MTTVKVHLHNVNLRAGERERERERERFRKENVKDTFVYRSLPSRCSSALNHTVKPLY